MSLPVKLPLTIATMGDMVIDRIVQIERHHLYQRVETVGRIRSAPGGSAASFAVWAARELGAEGAVTFIGKVGLDESGPPLIESLQQAGVRTCVGVVAEGEDFPTGQVLVLNAADGFYLMVSDPGAGRRISPLEVADCLSGLEQLNAFHLTSYSLFTEPPCSSALYACELARRKGAFLSLDPSSANQLTEMGADRYKELLRLISPDLLFPTLEEGIAVTGEEDRWQVVAALHEYVPLVVLKLGAEGCIVSSTDGLSEALPPVETKVVEPTGAGDAFAAAFLVEYLRSGDPIAAGKAGNRLGAHVVGMLGAR